MSPILPFTTEEAWEALPSYEGKTDSVHLEFFPEFKEEWIETELFKECERLGDIRGKVLKKLEEAREEKIIGNSLEAEVVIHAPSSLYPLLEKYQSYLNELFIVSSVSLQENQEEEMKVEVERVKWKKCERCWNYEPSVGTSKEYPEFCERCAKVVRSIKK
jgi:isoleucyl-tRNA synthetase